MKTYKVQYMTYEEYDKMMGGYLSYEVEHELVEAPNKEGAIKRVQAMHPNCKVNTYVQSLEEIAEEDAKRETEIKAEREKAARAAEKRAATEERNATAMGLTVKEYRTLKHRQATIKRYQKEIEAMRAEIAMREEYIAKYSR